MSNSAGSHKRRRTAFDAQQSVDSTVEASTTITRDTEFWFEDGTIILVAKNVQFRVFKGILSDHSPVFRDMFSLPQPASASILQGATDAFDACPVVHLSDSPEDLRHVLRACIPKSNSNFGNLFIQKDPSFPAISAIIRIGHKYQMQHLVAQGVQYLKRHFTDDLSTWANGTLCSEVRRRPQAQAIAIVNIARLVDEPSLLPTALLMCCSLDQAIIDGYTREDGTRETLSLEDLGRCFGARARLAEHTLVLATRIFNPSFGDSEACSHPEACASARRRMKIGVGDDPERFAHPNVFSSWLARFQATGDMDDCCATCREMLKRRDWEARLDVWEELPKIVGVHVDGWATNDL